MRRLAAWVAIVVGTVMLVAGVVTWVVVADTLSEQNITTSEDACLPDRHIRDPFTAYCEADAINSHVLEATDGRTYAELDQDDPLRETAMTGSFLQASLFTSVVAFGVALMAFAVGLVMLLVGLALRRDPVATVVPASAEGRHTDTVS
jgi:hypothetical protein